VAQAFVLRSLLDGFAEWFWATTIGWSVGVAIARVLLARSGFDLSPIADAIGVAAIAGATVGIPQAWILRRHFIDAAVWVAISCLGWAVLFPGMIPGAGLVWLARTRSLDPGDDPPNAP
jgi:hypothetical protein